MDRFATARNFLVFMAKKLRAVANLSMTVADYSDVVEEWLQNPPIGPLVDRLGGVLVKDFRCVTPDILKVVLPLLAGLVDK